LLGGPTVELATPHRFARVTCSMSLLELLDPHSLDRSLERATGERRTRESQAPRGAVDLLNEVRVERHLHSYHGEYPS
jgi:hypothetical protein